MRKNHWKSKLLTMLIFIFDVSFVMSNMSYGSSGEIKTYLTSTGAVSGYAKAEYEHGALKVELKNVPSGTYELYINGVLQGSSVTYFDDDGYYEAKLYAAVNPSGTFIEVEQGGQILFSGTFPGGPTSGGTTGTYLTSTGVVGGSAKTEYEHGALKVELKNVPSGTYDLYVNGVFQGSSVTYFDDGGYYEAKLYVVVNSSGALIEVKQGTQILFTGTFLGNTTGGTPPHTPTPKMYLSNTGVVVGYAEAEYEDEHGTMVLKVEIERVPDGSYDLYIEGSFKASMTTYLHDGYYKARVALTNINPVGAFIEIKEGSHLLFSGTFPDGSTSPTGFSATASGSTVTINCNTVSGATGYDLHYGYSSGNYAGTLDLGNKTSNVFTHVPSATYYLALTSFNGSVESVYSKEIAVTTGTNLPGKINPPACFRAAVSGNTVTISFDAVSDATGYKLYFGSTSTGNYIGSTDLKDTTSNVFIQVPTGTYYLALTAYNSSGESSYSNEVTFTITETLNPPTGFSATVNGSTVSIIWDTVNSATGYMLYYGMTTSGNYTGSVDLGNKTSNVFVLIPSGTYYLALTSYSNSQESVYSNEVKFTIP